MYGTNSKYKTQKLDIKKLGHYLMMMIATNMRIMFVYIYFGLKH